MLAGQRIPLGQRIPDTLHAVSVSMPTIADVVGYETRDPSTMRSLRSGYPRFVAHPCLRAIEAYWQELFAKPGQPVWLTTSEAMAARLQAYLGNAETKFIRHRGVSGVRLPADPDVNRAAKLFLQHVGGLLSSRQAEDYLVAEGLREAAETEELFSGDAAARALSHLRPLLGDADAGSIVLAHSGMNAAFATFEAINALQAPRGRKSWIKLGWLYADTMHILDKLSPAGARNEEILDVFDLDRLEALLAARGGEFAGIITEAPTNPLIQTMDLERIRALARRHGVLFVVDPTVQSPANVDVAPFADVIICSLTKYFAHAGDVMLGAIAATADCPEREALLAAIRANAEPVYPRDLARFARELDDSDAYVAQANANAAAVVELLQRSPKVRRVFWSGDASSAANFAKIARSPGAIGALLSFEYDGPLATFYDRLALPKGPSFGVDSTLVCPFIYLAHYDLVTSDAGRETLRRAGLSPELVRFSVGSEPIEEILAALADALR